MRWLDGLKFIITGKRYYYSIRLDYKLKNGKTMFSINSKIGLYCQNDVLNARLIKKLNEPLHLMYGVESSFLNNGILSVVVLSYLGYIK